jgi:hydroxymethylpyrimidine pyrophosphatase-like HAD family hydrolase
MTCQRRLLLLAPGTIWRVVAVPSFLAVVVDLDGTVVSDRAVSPATVCAAADLFANGTPLVAATARTPAGVATLDVLTPHLTAAVCCGGALGWSPSTGRVLWRHVIADDRVKQLVKFVTERIADAGIAAHDGRQWRITQGFAALRGSSRSGVVQIVAAAQDIGRHPACTIASYSAAGMIEIGPAYVDKGTGTRQVLDLLGIPATQVVAFGDMPNDLPVFALCGVSVAMGNAHPTVRAAATSVCACVHDDGVARALHEFDMTSGRMLRETRSSTSCGCRALPK